MDRGDRWLEGRLAYSLVAPTAQVVEEPSLSTPDGRLFRREQCSLPCVSIIPQPFPIYTRYEKVGLVTVGIASPPTSVLLHSDVVLLSPPAPSRLVLTLERTLAPPKYGGSSGVRTQDLRVKSPVLCQLS